MVGSAPILNLHCPHCGAAMELSAGRQTCGQCGGAVVVEQAAPPVIPRAMLHNGRDWRIPVMYAGGVVSLFAFPVGTVLGVALLAYARWQDRQSCRCGRCGAVVESARATSCPSCAVEFSGVMS